MGLYSVLKARHIMIAKQIILMERREISLMNIRDELRSLND